MASRVTLPPDAPAEPHPGPDLLRQFESLREVIESISSELELRPLLTHIIRRACELLDGSMGSIGLYDARQGVIRMEAVHNMPESEIGMELAPGMGLNGLILETRAPVVLDRYELVKVMTAPEFRDRAVVGVPIFWRDRLMGAFGVGAPQPRRFSHRDVEVLTLLGRHAAVAIENARQYEREAARNQRLAIMARIGQAITAALDLDTLCAHAVEQIHQLLGYPYVSIGLIDPNDGESLLVRHRHGRFLQLPPSEHRFHVRQGVMGLAARTRRVQLVNDVHQTPHYLPAPGASDTRAELAVPILHGPDLLGVLNLESDSPFDELDANSLQIIAGHLAVAISNARLFAEARKGAVLEERHRLSRDIHDSITQMIFSASLMAQSINPAWKRDPVEGERLADRVVGLTRAALTELRSLLHELRPESGLPGEEQALPAMARLRRDGLAVMARFEVQRLVGEQPACDLDLTRYRAQPIEVEEVLYRVLQEALHNVIKHAHATWAHIQLECTGGWVILRVFDDGVGFDHEALDRIAGEARGGMGRHSMRERVVGLGGAFTTRSEPGHGTVVEAAIPCRGSA